MLPALVQKRTGGESGQRIMRGYKVEMFLMFPKRGLRSFLFANVMEGDHHGGHLRTIGIPDRTRVDRYPSTLPVGDDPHHRVGARMAAQGSESPGIQPPGVFGRPP